MLPLVVFLLFCLLWAGGLMAYLRNQSAPPYLAEAKLLVRYVAAGPSQPGAPSVLETEREILTSHDLARQVVATLGPGTLIPGAGEAEEIESLGRWFEVQAQPNSAILGLTFRHEDPAVATRTLEVMIDQYFLRHLAIHRSAGAEPRSQPGSGTLPSLAVVQDVAPASRVPLVPVWFTIGLAALGPLLGLLLAALTWLLTRRGPPSSAPPTGALATS